MVSAVNRLPRKKKSRDSQELRSLGIGDDLSQDERVTLKREALYQLCMGMGIRNLAALVSVASVALSDQTLRK